MDKPKVKKPTPSIYKKILDVMKVVEKIQKDGFNKNQNYKFASAENFISTIRVELIKSGIVVGGTRVIGEPKLITTTTSSGGTGYLTSQTIEYKLVDSETGDEALFEIPGQGWDMTDKGVYKAHTGGFKYFLRTAFVLEMSDDPEKTQYQPPEQSQSFNNSNKAFDDAKKKIEEQRKPLMDEIKGIRIQMEDSGYQFDKKEISFFEKLDTIKYAVPELKNKVIPKLKEKLKLWEDGQFPAEEKEKNNA